MIELAKALGAFLVIFLAMLFLAFSAEREERERDPVDYEQCECVSIVCQVCPDPDTPIDLRWFQARGYEYSWSGKEWRL